MPRYETVHIQNSQKINKWFETREEAEQFLRLRKAIDYFNKIPNKGSLETKAQALLDNVDLFYTSLSEIDNDILEWVRPST